MIPGNSIGIAVGRRNRVLNDGVRVSVEKANAVCLELGKPEISRGIKGQVKGSTTFQHIPLAPDRVLRIKFTDRIAVGLGEPDMTLCIYGHGDGVRIPRRLSEILDELPIPKIIFSKYSSICDVASRQWFTP